MIKKILTLSLIMMLLLAGCNPQDTPQTPQTPETPETETPDTETEGTQETGWVPTQDVEFVIPFSAGGGSDVFARKIVEVIQKNELAPVNFIPTNKPGGSGVVGYTYLNGRGTDNAYVMATTSSSFYSQPLSGLSPLSLDDDFTYISLLVKDPNLFAAGKHIGLNTLEEVIDYAKANPRALKYGGTGNVSDDAILMYMINELTGIELVYVPYDSGAEVLAAVLGGHIDVCGISPSEGGEHLETGSLVPLAVSADERLAILPDVPTFIEAGYEISHQQSRGVVMNADVPEEAVKYYSELFKKVSETEEWKKFAEDNVMAQVYLDYEDYMEYSSDLADQYSIFMEMIERNQ